MTTMLNRRPRTAHTSRLVKVSRFVAPECDDRTSFYPLSTTPGWEIHRDTCRCPYCI